MKLTDLTIKDLITPEAKLTFLVGAGCSIDPPSCLPAGKAMMDAIIDYTCAESEIGKIKKLEDLRFEQLIEIIRDRLDPQLKVIDFYGLCDKPNIQHYFLSEMMKNGQFVFTTNFDFLIEYALQYLGVLKENIKIVITKNDFEQAKSPQELFSQGIKTLYKIHGSTKNIIKEESTRDSLIATIQAFGANKEGENVFQLESFKQPAFVNLTKGRSLVVMGYSGSDDFDIVPTLKVLEQIQDIIWINYVHEDGGKELIYEIQREDINNYKKLPKVDQILVDIKRMNYTKRVLRVDVNTGRMVKELIPTQIKEKLEPFSLDVRDWLSSNLKSPNKFIKLFIPYKIYFDFNIYKDAMSILNKILMISGQNNSLRWNSFALNEMGLIYKAQGNFPEALKRYEEALHIDEQSGNLSGKAANLSNIGMIFRAQGNYPDALKHFNKALQIFEQLGDLSRKAVLLNNIGEINEAQGNYLKALQHYEEALNIDEQLGNLRGKAIRLNNIGVIYKAQGNYPEAIKSFEEALNIDEQLGNLRGKAIRLNNIGLIYKVQGNYLEALNRYEEALRIDEQLGNLSGKADILNNIGTIYKTQGNYQKALKYYEEALHIDEQLGNMSGKAVDLNNIGIIYKAQGNYQKALKHYEEALYIDEQLGNLSEKATRLNNIGSI
ncbi:MAG: tetratricopeptide repeat protein, partial [Promethearchaeota archaeon]